MFFVYVTTNKVNGKRYVGFSSKTKPGWIDYLGSGKILKRAVQKYGKDQFERRILAEFETSEEAIEYEKSFIIENQCHLKEDWYNIAVGYTTQGFKGKTHTTETKRKISEFGRTRPATKRMKENAFRMSQLPKTEAQINACKANGRKNGRANSKRCTDGFRIFDSSKIMAEYYGLTPAALSYRIKSSGFPEFRYLKVSE